MTLLLLAVLAPAPAQRLQQKLERGVVAVNRTGGRSVTSSGGQGTPLWHAFCRIGEWSHIEKRDLWLILQKIADGKIFKKKSPGYQKH